MPGVYFCDLGWAWFPWLGCHGRQESGALRHIPTVVYAFSEGREAEWEIPSCCGLDLSVGGNEVTSIFQWSCIDVLGGLKQTKYQN